MNNRYPSAYSRTRRRSTHFINNEYVRNEDQKQGKPTVALTEDLLTLQIMSIVIMETKNKRERKNIHTEGAGKKCVCGERERGRERERERPRWGGGGGY